MTGLFELTCLLSQRVDEVLGEDFRVSANVEDVLFGIERGELAAKLRKRVHNLRTYAPHSRVEKREQPGGAGAYDRDVFDVVVHGFLRKVRRVTPLAGGQSSQGAQPRVRTGPLPYFA
jgi:hypothetical protein